jgi:ATP-binding cassette, subfamily B, vacuolar membrane transporter HMT1/ACLQ
MAGSPKTSISATQAALEWVEVAYPLVLSLAFIAAAAAWSVYKSRSQDEVDREAPKGPGGHLLPSCRRSRNDQDEEESPISPSARRIFRYVTAAIVLTFIANGVAVVLHVMQDALLDEADQRWFCDQSRLVNISHILSSIQF